MAESIGASVSQHKDRKIETPSLPWHLCSSMNTPLDVVSGIFAPEILECIDPSGEFLCGISFMELSERLDEVVITTAHAADMCIEESDASAPFEASALAILWHSSKTGGSGLPW